MTDSPVVGSSSYVDAEDIYRGPGPPPSLHAPRSASPSQHSTTSTSSSGSNFGRLGAIAAIVEVAISRWAGNEPSSSSSSSSSSDSGPIHRSRRNKSERAFSSRISRIQAREESRQIPRQFALYIPPSLASDANAQRVTETSSLPIILQHLETALRKSTRGRRQQGRDRAPRNNADPPRPTHLHFMLPDIVKAPSRPASFTDLNLLAAGQRKGKHKEGHGVLSARLDPVHKAWFLDVSSPTWEDMRAIGKFLHLHPLTLEDIVMQDPREKLEHFPKLGYHFISFRAIESWENREKYWDQEGDERDEGLVGEANVYLVVFKGGICSFHFTDISDHVKRVRNRIVLLEKVINMTSDWIAHGILDSIVDSFSPFLQGLEREVTAIDDIVFSSASSDYASDSSRKEKNTTEFHDLEKTDLTVELSEKNVARLEKSLPYSSLPWRLWRTFKWKEVVPKSWTKASQTKPRSTPTTSTLRRMARARRLVTTLSRLLAAKSEVVAQLRKRLTTSGATSGDDAEVAMYLGDVQDHILTLETALAHYERMLSQSHPLYISQVRTTIAITKSGSDKAIILLSSVSIAVLCIQPLIGVCSMNVHIIQNSLTGTKYNVFAVVIALSLVILGWYTYLVSHWWRRAKRKLSTAL